MIKKIIYLCMILPMMLLANQDLEITLEHNATTNKPLQIILTVTNISTKSVQIEPPRFAYGQDEGGGIVNDLFTVIEDGKTLPYIGIIASMIPHDKTLAPGESYQGYVNLEEYYKVSIGTHDYEIYYGHVNSTMILEIEATIKPRYKSSRSRSDHRGVCSSYYLSLLSEIQIEAQALALNSRAFLRTMRDRTLYTSYFGTASSGPINQVYDNYLRIANGFAKASYNCNTPYCRKHSAAAYVLVRAPDTVDYYPNMNKIHICNSAWKAYKTKRTRAGVLVHEMSHLVANTKDYSYKPIKLALTSPYKAVRNAANYQYFAVTNRYTTAGAYGGAYGGNSNGGNSNPSNGTGTNAPTPTPNSVRVTAPSYFRRTAITPTTATLRWNDNSNNELGFTILGAHNTVIPVAANHTAFTVQGLQPDTAYQFAIFAYNNTHISSKQYLTLRTKLAPVGQVKTSKITANSVTLRWKDNSRTEKGFKIYRGNTLIKTLPANTTSYTISNLKRNTAYTYTIKSYSNAGLSDGVTIKVRTKKSNDVPITDYIMN